MCFVRVDGMVSIYVQSKNLLIVWECDKRNGPSLRPNQYTPWKESRRMFAVNGQFPEHMIIIWVRQQPVSEHRHLACAQVQKDHCKEVAELIGNLKDSKFKPGERRIFLFLHTTQKTLTC